MAEHRKKLTIPDLRECKRAGERVVLASLTDYLMAQWADLIGAFDNFTPKFAKRFGNVGEVATNAFAAYASEVREGTFPDAEHSYEMPAEEADKLVEALASGEH